LLFCMLSFGDHWRFPGDEKPIFSLGGGKDAFWLVRKSDGTLPSLWYVAAGKAEPISPPEGSLYLAVHPDSNELLAVTPRHIAAYRPSQAGLVQTRRFWSPAQPYVPHGPPLYAQVVGLNNSPYLVFFHDGLCNVIALTEGGIGFQTATSEALTFGDEVALMNPLVQSSSQELMWMVDEGLRVWSPVQRSPLSTQPFPELNSMEQAVALPVDGESPDWLVYGGKRGELKGFGWKVGEGPQAISGSGILARFGMDRRADLSRLFVLTVSNRVRTQLWNAIAGNTEFQCTLLLRRRGEWHVANRLSFKMKKSTSKPRKSFGVTWVTDYNSDGYGDLVVVDEKRGVRAFFSDATGALAAKPVRLSGATEAFVNLPEVLLVCHPQAGDWRVEVLQQ